LQIASIVGQALEREGFVLDRLTDEGEGDGRARVGGDIEANPRRP
jgi:hypothetical protein